MKALTVEIPDCEYTIQIGKNIEDSCIPVAVQKISPDLVVVVTNTTIHDLYPFRISQCLESTNVQVETCILPDGEQYKTLEVLNTIYDFLLEKQANRKTLLIAFGGGVIGDMTGFAAATFMRGIPYIQVPTTLLAQVDSSVGGKTAVNHALGKNAIGAFKQPAHVCTELTFLKTLPPRELKAGFFELVKHGIIHKATLFDFIKNWYLNELDLDFLEEAVFQSCQVKANVVEQDEKEKNLRATLNFGHSLGHLLETHTHYTEYLHGEAVGVGMVFAVFVSYKLGFLDQPVYQELMTFFEGIVVAITIPPLDASEFKELLLHDKKAQHQAINFVLIRGIGECFIQKDTSPDKLWELFCEFIQDFSWACRYSSELSPKE